MCWVMPPASPAATSEERMASSSDVLPWSTWPMTVTTGARGCKLRRIVGDIEQAFFDVGFGHAAHAVAHFLGDQLGGIGVDHVVDRHHLPLLHQQADDVDRAFGHAVGKILDGDRFRDRDLAHELFLRLVGALPLRRWVRRRNEATERSRTSSARSAVTSVRRPRCFSAPTRGAGARARGRACGAAAGAGAALPLLRPRA